MAMGMATQRLGLGATYSTTYYEPYHVARLFATMDLMLEGRAAWNIVTSLNSAEARNFGGGEHMAHDARYDRADEFMDVVLGHWNTWEDDALILDKANNRFADPAKVHRLDHVGRYFSITRTVQCAAVAAGAAGIASGGTVGPRPSAPSHDRLEPVRRRRAHPRQAVGRMVRQGASRPLRGHHRPVRGRMQRRGNRPRDLRPPG
jgi:alkanesulfonate monooxygenase SsuD/methylene tetrahydromethanopterin reductase-like flavin-dependent oxidoreductase (luciferase family)